MASSFIHSFIHVWPLNLHYCLTPEWFTLNNVSDHRAKAPYTDALLNVTGQEPEVAVVAADDVLCDVCVMRNKAHEH